VSEPSIAILGAGLSGLMCARQLQQAGFSVQVFDKGRGVSGRMSLRRIGEQSGLQFDHGAQYFTARSPEFRQQVQEWQNAGVVADWDGPFVTLDHGTIGPDPGQGDARYVGMPGMNALCRDLAVQVQTVQCGLRVDQLRQTPAGWQLSGLMLQDSATWSCETEFAAVVCSIPAPQTMALFPDDCSFQPQLQLPQMAPCWCVMLELAERLPVAWSGAFVQNSPLRWIARDSAKPGRNSQRECWVLHASPEWSAEHLEVAVDQNQAALLTAFEEALGLSLPDHVHISSHRWRYAIPEDPLEVGCLSDPRLKLIACGDWASSARVEGAFRSGLAAAETVRQLLE